MDRTQLKQQRLALEALATTLESVEQDFGVVQAEFTAGAKAAGEFTAGLTTAATAAATGTGEKPLRVMLASSSKWRQALIGQILPEGFAVSTATAISPDIDEKAVRRSDPKELVLAIANAKADAVLKKLQAQDAVDLVICCDQVIVYDGQVREKPESEEECKLHLQSYGEHGIPAVCVTGMVVVSPAHAADVRVEGVEVATQHFKPVPDRVAELLIAKGDVMYCAGSFVVEDALLQPYLGRREGDLETVQGMPKQLTRQLLVEAAKRIYNSSS